MLYDKQKYRPYLSHYIYISARPNCKVKKQAVTQPSPIASRRRRRQAGRKHTAALRWQCSACKRILRAAAVLQH